MIRAWIGIAILAVSWLFGLGYHGSAGWMTWAVAIVTGAVLLGGVLGRLPPRREMTVALVLMLPSVWFMPWPYRAAPVLIAVGLALELARIPRGWPRRLGRGALVAGVVLLVQSMALLAYTGHLARSHELPRPLPSLIGAAGQLLGADVAVDGNTVALHVAGRVHRLGATWDLLLDPATLCFFFGGAALLALAVWSRRPAGSRWSRWLRNMRILTALVIAWLPLRVAVLVGLYLHRSLRTATAPPIVMNQFLDPWVQLLLLAGLVLLVVHFLGRAVPGELGRGEPGNGDEPAVGDRTPRWRFALGLGMVGLSVAIVAAVFTWDPVGSPKAGRVMFVERHSLWEPTTQPYDTTRYGELASYNYAAIYDYCSRYFKVSRLHEWEAINEVPLSQCDVLVIKTPTARYTPAEVAEIERFVAGGGGLLLIGDHTNVFRTSTYLNDITRRFGFTYRNDLLFNVGTPYEQHYRPPCVPHASVQHLPPMDFAVSCSIDPGTSFGLAAIRNTGLWSLPSAYHASNYHPQAEYRPEMRYGPFIQLWATRHDRGRVLAFTDSTIFSNFCTFQPGKAELMLGMIQWLNHSSPLDRLWPRLLLLVPAVLAALVMLAVGLRWVAGHGGVWISVLSVGLLGWTLASWGVVAGQRAAMPPPRPVRPMTRVIIDRTTSEVPLANGAFNESEMGYGMLEHWIPRVGCFTARRSGPAAFSGDLLVVICPSRSVSDEFRQGLVDYVAGGGKLLVIDSPLDGSSTVDDLRLNKSSTANSLLWPFGLAVSHADMASPGELMIADGWPAIPMEMACQVSGGEPFAHLGELCVGAQTQFGEGEQKGTVMAIGFGYLFNDQHMGGEWMLEPDEEIKAKYEVLYAILRGLLNDQPVTGPKQRPAKSESLLLPTPGPSPKP